MHNESVISALVLASFALPALADDQYFDTARVISVTPQTERVNTPRQECRTEYVQESYTESSPAGAIVGGIAGALLGSQIGQGGGRAAATVVGAGVGAVVGNNVGSTTSYPMRPVERCYSVDNWQNVSRGYLVTYRYNGRDYTTVTDQPPGDSIRVNVAVGVPQANPPVAVYQSTQPVYEAPPPVYREYVRPAPVVIVPSFGFNYGYGGYGPRPWGWGRGPGPGGHHW
ncbi:hypothetical protein A7981_10545 [Methylovorus sp. MM2]|uniref:glycine zipper 2TM domain-containing protein n=1 Tax=Methylovorus sp. MM2 TaxID=1848038 RepID=UPI0007E20F4E|nr:glycine zipper 2TM domain-containing protein [Methylovorus sp. MM2]OAM51173.1 hypothetical protein A7981_10545 [Methylovorus sp. MM2]